MFIFQFLRSFDVTHIFVSYKGYLKNRLNFRADVLLLYCNSDNKGGYFDVLTIVFIMERTKRDRD